MMSLIKDGEVLDYQYRQCKVQDFVTFFYVGDIYVGQIFKMHNGFSVVDKTPNTLSPINGLRSRWQAAELLLKMEGLQ